MHRWPAIIPGILSSWIRNSHQKLSEGDEWFVVRRPHPPVVIHLINLSSLSLCLEVFLAIALCMSHVCTK
ncbi:hypothetical protein K474DRAFT_1670793 [Panus rudis PR-1116 ss-1]|nr:hypothetical protein K474DRAFT_1670793 [Panus rudis PR-1116 ss-1]